jgi:peptidyl-prolyl cis-trans isomerase B (cyclophilin B)
MLGMTSVVFDALAEDGAGRQLETPELEVTDRVFMDLGLCTKGYKKDRRLGDASILCDDPESLGRIVIDLYGGVAPSTVKNFKRLIESGALEGTVVNRSFPGEFIAAGQQGSHRMGYLEAPQGIDSNSDLLNPSAFRLRHDRAGMVSLNLSENMDEEFVRNRKNYTEMSFLITTGPGPVPRLDEQNIVFGRVSRGLDVISRIAEVPTFKANKSLQVFTDLAAAVGDDRLTKKAATYGKPLTPVVFQKTGVLSDN